MTNTTWNPSDKAAGITLSGGDLTAKNTNNAVCLVRAAHSQTSGKFYWEYTFTTAATSTGAGVAKGTIGTATSCASPTAGTPAIGSCMIRTANGQVVVDGGSSGITNLGAIANGTVVCIAVDLNAQRIWFRLGAAGLWNNSGSADPASGSGGAAVSSISGVAVYPAANVNNTNNQIIANFGDTTFVGAVPSGFTSGFPTVAPGPTGRAKVWNGSAWVLKPVKVWSGSAWVEKPAKVWNGSAWV